MIDIRAMKGKLEISTFLGSPQLPSPPPFPPSRKNYFRLRVYTSLYGASCVLSDRSRVGDECSQFWLNSKEICHQQ